MFHRTDVKNVAVSASYSAIAGSKVTLTGSATVPTDFFNVLGFSEIDISATTTTTWPTPGCGWRSCSTIPVRAPIR